MNHRDKRGVLSSDPEYSVLSTQYSTPAAATDPPDPLTPSQSQHLTASPPRSLLPLSAPLRVAGHELTLFIESPPLIAAMLRDIHAARERVWLETYIFVDDAAGQTVAGALMERARAGVDVRVHRDAVGCFRTPSVFLQHMHDAVVYVD